MHVHLRVIDNYSFIRSVTHIEQARARILAQFALSTTPLHDNRALFLPLIPAFCLFLLIFVRLKLTVLVNDILRNDHKFFKHLLLEFLGKASNDELSVITVDSNSEAKLKYYHKAFNVHKSSLVDGPNRGLLYICLHRKKLVVKVDKL